MNKNQTRFKFPSGTKTNKQSVRTEVEMAARPLVQCWGCRGPHYVKNFPHHKGTNQVAQIQESSTLGDVARSMPKINATLEDHQAEYQQTMIEFEGKIFSQTMSILIDLRATLSYISPKIVEKCCLQVIKFKNPWLMQLTPGAKRRVLAKVNNCPL